MRLDKFIAGQLAISRASAGRQIRAGRITVNGESVKDAGFRLLAQHHVVCDGSTLTQITRPRYFMLNKPAGYVCSACDPDNPTLLHFICEPLASKLHYAGRLDVDATGLVLLTDDGQWSHRITSPRHHCEKTYRVTLASALTNDTATAFASGIMLRNEKKPARPAQLESISPTEARLTISEGRYHQVKRMFAALGNHVLTLHRERIGSIVLDPSLAAGEYRKLTEKEINSIAGGDVKPAPVSG